MSQSTIFQSCRDGAIASWVINQYFRGVKCLAQGHNTATVGLEPRTSRSGVRHSTTEPPLIREHCLISTINASEKQVSNIFFFCFVLIYDRILTKIGVTSIYYRIGRQFLCWASRCCNFTKISHQPLFCLLLFFVCIFRYKTDFYTFIRSQCIE